MTGAADPFIGLPRRHYGCILADPPWQFTTRSPAGQGKSPSRHYRTMPTAEIMAMPVGELAAPHCALFLWVYGSMLPDAMQVMDAWGFRYVSHGSWAKQSPTGRTWSFSTGYTFRGGSEVYLLGFRGRPKRLAANVRNLVVAPVREHSRKPDELRDNAGRMYGGPHLELFAREAMPGWTAWGDQVTRFATRTIAA